MRHIYILMSSALVACTAIGGASGKLGGGSVSSGGSSPSTGIADQYGAGVEVPRQLKAVEEDLESMQSHLDELEKKNESGNLTNPEDIHWHRITWLSFYGRMQRGGEPRCEPCKKNPKYAELKAKAADINARFAKLEMDVGKCTYGYRMTNGDLLPMTLDWSESDWKGVVEKALPVGYSQKERCWTDDKDGKAGKPHGWAY
jgi:hypothetical protein